jgi:hypothetical protein
MAVEARVLPEARSDARMALTRLEADGFILRRGETWKTSRRWQQAMARAAVKLYDAGDPGEDLRVPIALALIELYPSGIEDELMAELVETMLPIENASLGLAP